eukprot:TRINITY_DN15472_c0_g1_i2.p1 TRINITY_DN15472_c0_g1~~TRINITY_DN15472_c0_g1_i2.p1  ORF type:complete len:316 (-),score=75.90 TRINITY_DN15472_c0_g1_i2:30-929(-)
MGEYTPGDEWYFQKSELEKGKSPQEIKEEKHLRRITCTFLQESGVRLKLPQLTIATAILFFHRFYIRNKIKDFDRYIIGTVCMFLAAKVEDTPKRLNDVLLETYRVWNKKDIVVDSEEFNRLREQIVNYEFTLLQSISFDFTVAHPYKYLVSNIRTMQDSMALQQTGSKELAQVAWNFVNDSLRTTLCLQYRPDRIAVAAIFLASKFLKCQLSSGEDKEWWETYNMSKEEIEDISNQILDLYEESPGASALKAKLPGASSHQFVVKTESNPAVPAVPKLEPVARAPVKQEEKEEGEMTE